MYATTIYNPDELTLDFAIPVFFLIILILLFGPTIRDLIQERTPKGIQKRKKAERKMQQAIDYARLDLELSQMLYASLMYPTDCSDKLHPNSDTPIFDQMAPDYLNPRTDDLNPSIEDMVYSFDDPEVFDDIPDFMKEIYKSYTPNNVTPIRKENN